MEQEQRTPSGDTDKLPKVEDDAEMAVSESEIGQMMILETENEDKTEELSQTSAIDSNSPEKEKGWDDMAKNIEIRRLSNTDDGNKVLEATFHSPHKDLKKNPLMNIFNIVSGMEAATPAPEENLPRGLALPIPGPTALGALRPQLRGRKNKQYSTLPPLPHSPPPWVLGAGGPRPQLPPSGGPQQIMLAPQMMVQNQGAPQQQVMQLVQTVNGPMLVPLAPQNQMLQLQPSPATLLPQVMGPRAPQPSAPLVSSPPGIKGRGPRPDGGPPPGPSGPAPLLMGPTGGLISFQSSAPPVSSTQMVTFTQAGPSPGAQLVVGGQGVQGMILMPQPQGILYQQLPDGSLVQVQGQVQGLMPQGQILVPGPGQMVPGGPGPQLVVAPGGLVQGLAPIQAGFSQRQILPGASGQQTRKKPSAKKGKPKKKAKEADEGAEQEQDETDTSYEEPQPSTSKSLSPRSSIQSNKVDSSGLNATPPHQKDAGDFEQLRLKSPESEMEFRDLLDTSAEGDEREEDCAETSASNLSFVEEKIVLSEEDEESELEEDQPQHSKLVSSSSKKRKKKKKKSSRENHQDRSRSRTRSTPEEPSPPESPIIPPEPRDFRVGDLVWGPAHGFPSWPGKLVGGHGERERGRVWVCWFGTREMSQVEGHRLKTLSEGLEAHHRERKKSRR